MFTLLRKGKKPFFSFWRVWVKSNLPKKRFFPAELGHLTLTWFIYQQMFFQKKEYELFFVQWCIDLAECTFHNVDNLFPPLSYLVVHLEKKNLSHWLSSLISFKYLHLVSWKTLRFDGFRRRIFGKHLNGNHGSVMALCTSDTFVRSLVSVISWGWGCNWLHCHNPYSEEFNVIK